MSRSNMANTNQPVVRQAPSASQEYRGKSTAGTYDPAKSPLLPLHPHELRSIDKSRGSTPESACPLLPLDPGLSSSPLPITQMEAYLRSEESHEMRLINLDAAVPVNVASGASQAREAEGIATESQSWDTSSWAIINEDLDSFPHQEKRPGTPQIQPAIPHAKADAPVVTGPIMEADDNMPQSSDSGISDLSLSAFPAPGLCRLIAREYFETEQGDVINVRDVLQRRAARNATARPRRHQAPKARRGSRKGKERKKET
ncbi:hypothetical protein FZEAL_6212 [Fusarium zealandicum]|uniref:Uncharacterized protein n=1 Tax=Fusarium zealandicum TaxID=1053134 RepID=A0A8H4XJQ4_9HYPO|nr:hypothetical protein FZEAL_6212 [Fusarium zealandicum]